MRRLRTEEDWAFFEPSWYLQGRSAASLPATIGGWWTRSSGSRVLVRVAPPAADAAERSELALLARSAPNSAGQGVGPRVWQPASGNAPDPRLVGQPLWPQRPPTHPENVVVTVPIAAPVDPRTDILSSIGTALRPTFGRGSRDNLDGSNPERGSFSISGCRLTESIHLVGQG
ncbi:MAG: hypothetical protein JWR00_993 [Rubritepida sp.]|nr:hypothetical protein [Rubritepida sp.]